MSISEDVRRELKVAAQLVVDLDQQQAALADLEERESLVAEQIGMTREQIGQTEAAIGEILAALTGHGSGS